MKDIDTTIQDIYTGGLSPADKLAAVDAVLVDAYRAGMADADKIIADARAAGYGSDAVQYMIDKELKQ